MAGPTTVTTRWRPDRTWCRPGGGAWVAGGVPLRLWRLGAAGRRMADAVEGGATPPDGHEPLTRRLVEAGVLHPEPMPAEDMTSLTVVIPTLDPPPDRLRRLTDQVRAEVGPAARVLVVDDASPSPVTAGEGVEVVRTPHRCGPAGTRNHGVTHTDDALVLFLDDDVELPSGWLAHLIGQMNDPSVGAVAPRVGGPVTHAASTWWERSEQVRSPLDLGWEPAVVRPGSTVPYVPSAALLVRRTALQAVGGFDPELRFGEDVDLVWRLHQAGWTVRYDPRVIIGHRARPTAWAGLRQRFQYGTSAAPLARRHPSAIAAVRLSPATLVAWMLLAIGHPATVAAAGVTTGRSAVDLRRLLRSRGVDDADRWALRWTLAGQWAVARQLAQAWWRPWWPMALCAAAVSRRGRWLAAVATVMVTVDDLRWWRRSRALDPVRFWASARCSDLAYGLGVWWGAWHHRTAAPLRVDRRPPDKVSHP